MCIIKSSMDNEQGGVMQSPNEQGLFVFSHQLVLEHLLLKAKRKCETRQVVGLFFCLLDSLSSFPFNRRHHKSAVAPKRIDLSKSLPPEFVGRLGDSDG